MRHLIARAGFIGALGALGLFLTSRPVAASPITFCLRGHVTQVTDPHHLLNASVAVGTNIKVTYTFESATPDANPDSAYGEYPQPGPPSELSGTTGNYTFGIGPPDSSYTIFMVNNGVTGDAYRISGMVLLEPGGVPSLFIAQLFDGTATALSSTALLLSPPDLSKFTVSGPGAPANFIQLSTFPFGPPQDYIIEGVIDAISEGPCVDLPFFQFTIFPPFLNFGKQVFNTTSTPQTVTYTNVGEVSATYLGFSVVGDHPSDFAVTPACLSPSPVPPHKSCSLQVTFTPGGILERKATLVIHTSAGDYEVKLSGSGILDLSRWVGSSICALLPCLPERAQLDIVTINERRFGGTLILKDQTYAFEATWGGQGMFTMVGSLPDTSNGAQVVVTGRFFAERGVARLEGQYRFTGGGEQGSLLLEKSGVTGGGG
jgi:HYDIN/CFA65/VesB-like, Ig-like domain